MKDFLYSEILKDSLTYFNTSRSIDPKLTNVNPAVDIACAVVLTFRAHVSVNG